MSDQPSPSEVPPSSIQKMFSLSPSEKVDNDKDESDAEERLARSRERNREHARRTRLRKKAQLQALQSKVKELQAESRLLKQAVEECSIASILLGLSSGKQESLSDNLLDLPSTRKNENERDFVSSNITGKRKRFLSDAAAPPQPMILKIKGKDTLVGSGSGNGKTHINWKSGVYNDENGIQMQLSSEELETLRRERNRMHAKMTRDRKKCFISAVERTIAELESENKKMREILAKQAQHHSTVKVMAPAPSPVVVTAEHQNISSSPGTFQILQPSPPVPQVASAVSPCPVLKVLPPPEQSSVTATGKGTTNGHSVTHGFTVIA